MQTTNKYSAIYYVGLGIVFIYAMLIFGGFVNLIFGQSLTSLTAPLSIISFVALFSFYLNRTAQFNWLKSVIIPLVSISVFGICLWWATFYHETLFDAIWYHHDAVYNLAKSWNPYKRYLAEEETAYCFYYLNYFPIGNWVYGASIYLFTQTIEAAKGISLALILASSFILCGGLLANNFAWSKWKSISIGILISLNPITLLNLFTFYLDGPIAIVLSLGIIFIVVQIFGKDETAWLPAFICFAVLTHLKITGTVYTVIFMLVFAILVVIKSPKTWRIWFLRFSLFVILVVGVFGYHPFISNTFDKGHPFFPVAENPEINFFGENNYPENFKDLNRFQKFGISLYSEAGWVRSPDKTKIKTPFSFNGLGSYGSGIPDIGAFGPIFQETFTLALLIFLLGFIINKDKKYKWFMLVFTLVLLISIFINPEAYIFRYVPHFWLLIVVFAASLWEHAQLKWLSFICLLGLFFNVYRMEVKVISSVNQKTKELNSYLELLLGNEDEYAIDSGWAKSFKMRLGENKIDTSKLVWISPTDTPFTELPGSLGGKFKLRSALIAQ